GRSGSIPGGKSKRGARQKRRAGVRSDVRGASARKPIRLGRPKGESRRSFESGEYSSCSSSGTPRGLRGYRALPERRRLLVRFAKSIRTDNGIHIFKWCATASSF